MAGEKVLLSLPQDKLPECWNDEARMNVLFAPFRSRTANPQDWDYKLSFWKNLICTCCTHSKVYSFKIEDLQKLLNKDGRSPGCLNIVIDEMYKSGEIKPMEQFLQKPAQTWSGWATNILIKKPIVWSYSKIKDSLVAPNTNQTFVHLLAVQTDADALLASIPEDLKNKVISLQELLEITGIDQSKANSVKLLLHHLMCNNKVDIREITSENKQEISLHNLLIKFVDLKKLKHISDIDISIHILEQNEKTLTKNLEKLENEVLAFISEAKAYLAKGQRQMAKSCLRKKHEIEKRITKRANALQNVQVLLSRVRDADTDSQVLDSYKLALSTLRKTFKETGLTEDSVVDTMTELSEMLDIHEDIQSSLSQPLSGDDADLEDELAELIASDNTPTPPKPPSPLAKDSDTEELERRLHNLKLPEVPSTSPVGIKSKISL